MYRTKKGGFTLVETLVAISILTVAVSGAFFAAENALIAAAIARDQLTASYLAQEGIEYVRSVRDDDYLADPATAWTSFLSDAMVCAASCQLDPAAAAQLQACAGASCTPLYLATSASVSFYTQQAMISGMTMETTPFTRTIRIETVSPTEESVVSTVSWKYHERTYSISVTDHLTPWQ